MPSVLSEQLKKVPAIVSGRWANAEYFQVIFSGIDGLGIQNEVGNSSWFGFSLIFDAGKEKRDELVKVLSAQGIDCRPIVAGNFVRNDVVKYFNYEVQGELVNSDKITDCGFFIGNHHHNVEQELKDIPALIQTTLSN